MNTKMESESTPLPLSTKLSGFAATFEEHRQKTLSHLLTMAKTQGFKHHAWHRVKELENDIYGFYSGIQAEFLQKVKENQ
jgi:peroxiredoxin